jgi:hypothetical protein
MIHRNCPDLGSGQSGMDGGASLVTACGLPPSIPLPNRVVRGSRSQSGNSFSRRDPVRLTGRQLWPAELRSGWMASAGNAAPGARVRSRSAAAMADLVPRGADRHPGPRWVSLICRFRAGPSMSRSRTEGCAADGRAGRRQATRNRCTKPRPGLDTGRARGQNDLPKTARRAAGLS